MKSIDKLHRKSEHPTPTTRHRDGKPRQPHARIPSATSKRSSCAAITLEMAISYAGLASRYGRHTLGLKSGAAAPGVEQWI